MIRRPPRSTLDRSSAASDVYKRQAKRNHIKVGLCGQAPSDIPAFAQFLVEEGIDSISFNPDALIRGIENILEAEKTHNKP